MNEHLTFVAWKLFSVRSKTLVLLTLYCWIITEKLGVCVCVRKFVCVCNYKHDMVQSSLKQNWAMQLWLHTQPELRPTNENNEL